MAALLSVLWEDRVAWQHRLVYRIELITTTHARVSAGYQVVVRREDVELSGFPVDGRQLRGLLPLTWRPKELLLNLAITSSSQEPVHLLTRADIAGLQSGLFLEFLSDTDLVLDVDWEGIRDVVEAIARFMPRRARAAADLDENSSLAETTARLRDPTMLARFLTAETGIVVTSSVVEDWARSLRGVEARISAALGGPASSESSSENFILALSELPALDVLTLSAAVRLYCRLVLALVAWQENPLLGFLARLGREWTVIVDIQVDLDRPMTVTMSDDRPLIARGAPRDTFQVPVPLEDAGSLHVETQLLDPSAFLKDVKLLGADGETQLPLSDDVRETHDRHAVYLSAWPRPAHGIAQIRVGLTSDVQRTNRFVLALAVAALVLATLVESNADTLALLVIPTTLAVSVVQVRERTSIIRLLTSASRTWLFGIAVALWLVAALRLLIQSEGESGLLDAVMDLVQGAS